jgi:hypothetical protein
MCALYSSGLGYCPMAGCCEHGKTNSSTKGGSFFAAYAIFTFFCRARVIPSATRHTPRCTGVSLAFRVVVCGPLPSARRTTLLTAERWEWPEWRATRLQAVSEWVCVESAVSRLVQCLVLLTLKCVLGGCAWWRRKVLLFLDINTGVYTL